jgi:peptide deformylase
MSVPLELTLTLYPSPVLRKVTPPISAFDEELQATVTGMLEVMYESGGIGLAAPQVGLGLRLLVINETGDQELVLVNPTITSRGKETTLYEEGCLSFPEIYAEVSRPDACTVQAQDVKGEALSLELTGFLSRIVQHELDHLEGILLVDRMSAGDKLRNRAALENLVDDYKRSR